MTTSPRWTYALALLFSACSATAALFSVYLAWGAADAAWVAANAAERSSRAAFAEVRPTLDATIPRLVQPGERVRVPVWVTNRGGSRARILSCNWGGNVFPGWKDVVLHPGQSNEFSLRVSEYHTVIGKPMSPQDVRMKVRQVDLRIRYAAIDLEGAVFEEELSIPIPWDWNASVPPVGKSAPAATPAKGRKASSKGPALGSVKQTLGAAHT